VVSFEDAREEKNGGKDPTLVANERGSYGIPTPVKSGKAGTKHAPELVPAWASDVLRSAGYAPTPDADSALPRVHLVLKKLWGDQIPIPGGITRSNFWIDLQVQVFAAGSDKPSFVRDFRAEGGNTTVMVRFDDPAENGFVRLFDDATKQLVTLMGTPEWAEAVPGGDASLAATAAENLGPKQAAKSGEAGAADAPDDSVTTTAEDLPKQFASWDPAVYQWGGKSLPLGFIAGGIGVGLTIGGDQWARSLAVKRTGISTYPKAFYLQGSTDHIYQTDNDPYLAAGDDPPVPEVVQGYVSDIMYTYGVHMTVVSFGQTIATLVPAAAGADLQTVKAVMGFSGAATYIPTAVFLLQRFGTQFAPQWALNQAQSDRWHHLGPGLFPLVMGVFDIAFGTINGVFGGLYASGVLTARADEKGLFAPPTAGRRGLQNQAWMVPVLTPTADGGLSFGIVGRY
jgi:hypothetical protein